MLLRAELDLNYDLMSESSITMKGSMQLINAKSKIAQHVRNVQSCEAVYVFTQHATS